MRGFRIAFVLLLGCAIGNVLLAAAAAAQSADDLEALQRQIAQLYQSGNYSEAMSIAQQALTLGEQRFGPDDARLGTLLNNVATLNKVQRRYAEAEPFYQRALAIQEKALGSEHASVGKTLSELAHLYALQRRYAEAEPLFERSLAITEATLGADHPDLVATLDRLALLHEVRGRYAQAEPLYQRVLAIREKTLGADHADVAVTLDKLALTYRMQGRYAEAGPLYKRSIAIKEKALGPDSPQIAVVLNELARLHELQQQYAEAEPLYLRALAITEKVRGPEHPDVAAALYKVAITYQMQNRYADAEPLYKRALAITEATLGPDHPDVRGWLDRLASLYEAQRRYAEVEPLYQRALAIMEKARGPDHPDLLSPINNLAFLYQQQHRFDEAEVLLKRSLAIAEKQRGVDDPSVRNPLNSLAMLYKRQGRYADAEPLYKRVLALAEKDRGGPDNTYVQSALNDLIEVYSEQARYADAEPLMRRLFAVADKKYEADPQNVVNHLSLHTALNRLGRLLQDTARLDEAETLFRRALDTDEKRWGPLDQHVFTDLINLGGLLQETNRLAEAEPIYRRALALAENYGPNYEQARALNALGTLLRESGRPAEAETLHRRALPLTESFGYDPHVASTLGNLAGLLQDSGRLEEAEALYRRALALNEKSFGPDHPNVAIPLNNLATLLQLAKRFGEAELLYRRALVIGEKSYGPNHPRVATRLGNLADLLHDTDRLAEAEPLMRRSLAIDEQSYGPDHPKVAKGLSNLARLLKDTNRLGEAEALVSRALAIDEKSYGADHVSVATDLNNLAVLRTLDGRWSEAVALYARAKPGLIGRGGAETGDKAGFAKAVLTQNSWSLRHYARALYRADPKSPTARQQGFELAQWAQQTEAADALAQMSVRFVKGEGPLANLVRERQDLVARRQSEDKRLLAAVGRADGPAVAALRTSIGDIDKGVESVDAQLTSTFPEYAGLASPKPLASADIQALLNADEALLVFLDIRQFGQLPEETLAWVITKKTDTWHSIPLGTRALADSVMALRCGLDHTLWSGEDSAEKCRALLQGAPGSVEGRPPFDLARAHELYKALLGPVRDLIKDKQLLIVPSGPLTSLPFSVLVTEPPGTVVPTKLADYRRAAWLGARQPISVLPSVASLAALRRQAKSSTAPEPFLGYGDPVLLGQPGCGQIVVPDKCPDEEVLVAASERTAVRGTKASPSVAGYFRDGQANVAEVRKLCPLPDTAHELRCVARSLGAEPSAVVVGKDMTEAAVKVAQLSRYRIVHFATHGLLAGETEQFLKARAEPALVMSPPEQPTEEDDGLLTASEVAGLKLDADWVVLSACNTAGGEEPGAEALSGLARAFFYAGARALLVSHWPVDSYAATTLTSRTFAELRKSATIGRAEGFRRAMLALINDDKRPWAAHPSTWAPFVVVGAGSDLAVAGLPAAAKKVGKARAKDDWTSKVFGQQ
jgi:tetratricopeptide (TPR) repeat protein/CHAT domain-containing protein